MYSYPQYWEFKSTYFDYWKLASDQIIFKSKLVSPFFLYNKKQDLEVYNQCQLQAQTR